MDCRLAYRANGACMHTESLYRIALTLVPNIGPVQAKLLTDTLGSATDIFRARQQTLESIEGIGSVKASCIRRFNSFNLAEDELRFAEKFGVQLLFLTDENYPKRLLHCYDPPTLLYYRGEADLNHPRMLSVIGTRNKTDYGKQLTEQLVRELCSQNITVVSGLALGIDAVAHKTCVKNSKPTVAVVGHGLDNIYPPEHRPLARDICRSGGGMLTEFRSNTRPDRHHFPLRNRIVAGISDATIVVETDVKGGSMITASLANSYNRDVFAYPGKTTDTKSAGCNQLIRNNRAVLVTSANEILDSLGWIPQQKPVSTQTSLFVALNEEEKKIVQLLAVGSVHIDTLRLQSGISAAAFATALLQLELKAVITTMPGNMYKLL